jgi:hypothetical protein
MKIINNFKKFLNENKTESKKFNEDFNQKFPVDNSILKKLIAGETIITKNSMDLAGLLIKLQVDKEGNQVGVSDLPELKGMQFHYEFNPNDLTYLLKRI